MSDIMDSFETYLLDTSLALDARAEMLCTGPGNKFYTKWRDQEWYTFFANDTNKNNNINKLCERVRVCKTILECYTKTTPQVAARLAHAVVRRKGPWPNYWGLRFKSKWYAVDFVNGLYVDNSLFWSVIHDYAKEQVSNPYFQTLITA